jgi:5-methyltetrahydrofolate--homocysteine methyltransferase
MIRQIIDNRLIEAKGIVGFYAANTVNHDDIQLYSDETR